MMGRYSYEITYACGHTGEVEFYGKERDCEWRAEQEAKKICPDCVEKKKEEETAQAKAWAKEKGLPDLEGTERQIAWAEVIRRRLFEDLEECKKKDQEEIEKLKTNPSEKLRKEWIENEIDSLNIRLQAADEIKEKWEKQSLSRFWIDGRNTSANWEIMGLCRPIRKRREEDLESKVYENGATEDEEIRIYISPERNEVKILSEYNEKKVAILKRMGFKFFDFKKCWYRYPSPAMPTVSDIAATAANELVKAGFVVRVFDQDVMSLLDTESFRPFNPRELIGDDHQFIMRLDDEIKEMALSLPGAKEIKGRIRIPAKYRAEVDDFAHVYGFAISEAAQALIDEKPATLKTKDSKLAGADALYQKREESLDDLIDD